MIEIDLRIEFTKIKQLIKGGMSERGAAEKVAQERPLPITPDALRRRYRRRGADGGYKLRFREPKRITFTVASDFAEMAITNLGRIPADDQNAIRGLNMVIKWAKQRKTEIYKEKRNGRSNNGNK